MLLPAIIYECFQPKYAYHFALWLCESFNHTCLLKIKCINYTSVRSRFTFSRIMLEMHCWCWNIKLTILFCKNQQKQANEMFTSLCYIAISRMHSYCRAWLMIWFAIFQAHKRKLNCAHPKLNYDEVTFNAFHSFWNITNAKFIEIQRLQLFAPDLNAWRDQRVRSVHCKCASKTELCIEERKNDSNMAEVRCNNG